MLIPVLLFLVGFGLLIKGGDWFVDGSVGIARRFHLPELLIGATIVSIGTTLPEVMVSSQAALEGNAGISYGNAIGSIICNTSLIAAITVTARPGKVNPKTFSLPTAFFFAAALSYAVIAWTSGRFQRWMGICYLAVFVIYMTVSTVQMRKRPELTERAEEENAEEGGTGEKEKTLAQELLFLVIGAAAIAVGARFLVDNGSLIAAALGVPDSVVGLTMIALGTSLPEFAVSGQYHRGKSVQHHSGQRHGHHDLSLFDPCGENRFGRGQFQPGHRPSGDAGRDGNPVPARSAEGRAEALAGNPAAVHLRCLYRLPIRIVRATCQSELQDLTQFSVPDFRFLLLRGI